MSFDYWKRQAAVVVVPVVAAGCALFGSFASAAVTVPETIPLTLTNNSGSDEPVYIYNLGTMLDAASPTNGKQGWAEANGKFHPWIGGANPPISAPDASISGPAKGHSITIEVPKLSGRIYFSYGKKLEFKLAPGPGLVQPAVQNPTDPNRDTLFNWTEYTLTNSGIFINSTQVDMFSAPYEVGATGRDGVMRTTGSFKPGGYQAFFRELQAQPGGWANLIQTSPGDSSILRALSPLYGIETRALPPAVLDDYVNRVWQKYSTDTLTVTPDKDRPDIRYLGRVSGEKMVFTDTLGTIVTSFEKPDASSIFGCHQKLDAPNDSVRGPISRTLCAGYHRATLLTNSDQPDGDASHFYQDNVTNHYDRIIHEQMADGKAYAFAFDDVGNHESLVSVTAPQSAQIVLEPFTV
ncbi:beta-1,3-glucanase family protein [Rhodococcus erythropolis]|uniref:beta-1,3-glucanase family protein n=1 Tax=Rhodococcus erythropolis TaxID=1833 RepID=UPI0029497DBC|nr:beta-1,3-glucanase family protein [Rhodococcus erythropolis]MDV6278109.1 beta-1,3-glucanase family protein [Rhodococcus erythropolis]